MRSAGASKCVVYVWVCQAVRGLRGARDLRNCLCSMGPFDLTTMRCVQFQSAGSVYLPSGWERKEAVGFVLLATSYQHPHLSPAFAAAGSLWASACSLHTVAMVTSAVIIHAQMAALAKGRIKERCPWVACARAWVRQRAWGRRCMTSCFAAPLGTLSCRVSKLAAFLMGSIKAWRRAHACVAPLTLKVGRGHMRVRLPWHKNVGRGHMRAWLP